MTIVFEDIHLTTAKNLCHYLVVIKIFLREINNLKQYFY